MKVINIIEEDDHVRSVYVRSDGDVTVYDRERKLQLKVDVAGADTTWQILARVVPGVVDAERRSAAIEALADRCRTGWSPVPGEIDPEVPQHVLRRGHFGIDLMRYPDDEEDIGYSRADVLMGIDENGHTQVSGEILWIAADRSYAVCSDSLRWTPGEQ